MRHVIKSVIDMGRRAVQHAPTVGKVGTASRLVVGAGLGFASYGAVKKIYFPTGTISNGTVNNGATKILEQLSAACTMTQDTFFNEHVLEMDIQTFKKLTYQEIMEMVDLRIPNKKLRDVHVFLLLKKSDVMKNIDLGYWQYAEVDTDQILHGENGNEEATDKNYWLTDRLNVALVIRNPESGHYDIFTCSGYKVLVQAKVLTNEKGKQQKLPTAIVGISHSIYAQRKIQKQDNISDARLKYIIDKDVILTTTDTFQNAVYHVPPKP